MDNPRLINLWQTGQGQILDADRRYIMLRTDVLIGIFRQCPPKQQQEALQAFSRSVHQNGGASAKAYFEALNNDTQQLLATMTAFSAALGWGLWQFTPNPEPGQLALTVQNSPFAAGYGSSSGPVCHAITGMLTSVGELVLNSPVTGTETHCATQGHEHCAFVARSSTPPVS